ncbi:MAG: DUF3108 domain-containing protein, partial [Proteobacteria bacterium]|nr:DUF3108 domain-containing protein [Pseudomonadota bacterium]
TLDDELSPPAPSLDAYLTPLPLHPRAAPSAAAKPPRQKTRHRAPLLPSALPLPETAAIEPPPAVPTDLPKVLPAAAEQAAARLAAPPQQQAREEAVERTGAAPVSPWESSLPRQGRIHFSISRGDQGFVIGQSVHRWSHDGKRYALSSITETTGLAALFKPARVMQASEGGIDAAGLHPSEFRTERNGIAGEAASFDWTGMKLRLSAGSQREAALVNGAQDMLSMFYQLGAVFPWVPREPNEIMVATGRKFERYAFEAVGEETLATRHGEMRTLHLRSAAGVEAIDIWVCLDLHGLPLKIRYTDRQGDSFEQVAAEIEIDGIAVPTRNR